MIKNYVCIQDALDLLNEALSIDRKAITDLINHRVPCNDGLADHDAIQVDCSNNQQRVGILGIINGIFGIDKDNRGPIAAYINREKFEKDGTVFIESFSNRLRTHIINTFEEEIKAQEMLIKICEWMDNRIDEYTDSRHPTEQEVYIMWLLTEIERLTRKIAFEEEEVKGILQRRNFRVIGNTTNTDRRREHT